MVLVCVCVGGGLHLSACISVCPIHLLFTWSSFPKGITCLSDCMSLLIFVLGHSVLSVTAV